MADVVERVRCVIKNAHVFKLPPRANAQGWRGADWTEEVWQGMVKVIERGDKCAIILAGDDGKVFAVCPVKEGAVDRCVDSSRYFVLRIENAQGKHMFVGLAFNERNDAFDFNTALEDSRREKEAEKAPPPTFDGPKVDYSLKEGQKIHVAVPKVLVDGKASAPSDGQPAPASSGGGAAAKRLAARAGGDSSSSSSKGGLLAPSAKDTQSRLAPGTKAVVGGGSGAPAVSLLDDGGLLGAAPSPPASSGAGAGLSILDDLSAPPPAPYAAAAADPFGAAQAVPWQPSSAQAGAAGGSGALDPFGSAPAPILGAGMGAPPAMGGMMGGMANMNLGAQPMMGQQRPMGQPMMGGMQQPNMMGMQQPTNGMQGGMGGLQRPMQPMGGGMHGAMPGAIGNNMMGMQNQQQQQQQQKFQQPSTQGQDKDPFGGLF